MSEARIRCPRCNGAMKLLCFREVTTPNPEHVARWKCYNCEFETPLAKDTRSAKAAADQLLEEVDGVLYAKEENG